MARMLPHTTAANTSPTSGTHPWDLKEGLLIFKLPPCPPAWECIPGLGMPRLRGGQFHTQHNALVMSSSFVRSVYVPRTYAYLWHTPPIFYYSFVVRRIFANETQSEKQPTHQRKHLWTHQHPNTQHAHLEFGMRCFPPGTQLLQF